MSIKNQYPSHMVSSSGEKPSSFAVSRFSCISITRPRSLKIVQGTIAIKHAQNPNFDQGTISIHTVHDLPNTCMLRVFRSNPDTT